MDAAIKSTKTDRRNFRLGVANGLLYITAETVMDPTLVMVAFLSHLTQSPLLLGLVLPIRDGAWSLPQLWVSGYLQNVPHKLSVYRLVSILRIATWLSIALTMNLIHNADLLLILFFTAFLISAFASGFSGLPFLEVVSKTIPPERRGEFFAWRSGLGGLGSLVASLFVRWVLDPAGPLPFPYNYGCLSIIFLVLAGISALSFSLIHEPVEEQVPPRQSFPVQVQRAVAATREDHRYRAFLFLESLLMLGGSAAPFFAIYVQQELGGSQAMIGIYLAALTATNLLSNIYFGQLSRRVGNNRVMIMGVAAGLGMSGLALLLAIAGKPMHLSPAFASFWLIPVFVLSGVRGSAMGVATNSLLMEIAPGTKRSLYLGFTNTVMGTVLLLTGVSGVIVKMFGFPTLVAITLFAHFLALQAGRQVSRLAAYVPA